eukprot:7097320-Prymnesium_polylepis.1
MLLCPTVLAAVGGCVANGAQFVGCLYIATEATSPGGRVPDRNDPKVIKQRFVRVAIASVIAPFVMVFYSSLPGGGGGGGECLSLPLVRAFGLWSASFYRAALAPLALTMWLFLGPLLTMWLDRDRYTPLWTQLKRQVQGEHARLQLTRNLVVGPLAEEWVFRACMCPMLHAAGLSDGTSVFVAAVTFGASHIHHRFDGGMPWLAVAFQFTYTSLFGAYSAYLFLRTGLVIGPLLAHAFCNSMGVPDFGGIASHPQSTLVAAVYVLGLGGFIALVTVRAAPPAPRVRATACGPVRRRTPARHNPSAGPAFG